MASTKAHRDATAPQFEEAQKKPAGSHSTWHYRRLNKMPPFQTSRRVKGNQRIHILCGITGGSKKCHPSIFRGGSKGTSGCLLRTTTSISKNIIVVLVASTKAHRDATAPQFEEAQKKPAGSHSTWHYRRLNKMPPFQTSRRVEGNQGVPFIPKHHFLLNYNKNYFQK